MKVQLIKKDLSDHPELEGGYGDPETQTIYVDPSLPLHKQKELVVHEALELNLGTEIEHPRFDIITKDILDVLDQLYTSS